MKRDSLAHFVCPFCRGGLVLDTVSKETSEHIKEGALTCAGQRHRFEIRECIPRFIQTDINTSAFGFEWNKHPNTQFDSVNGMQLTERRFYRQTNWPRDLTGQKILEIGSGAGRFTEIALQTGAQVFSVDASHAVDANWANHGRHPNLTLCQASLYELPFRESYFDKVFCFGVLQHTPDVPAAFAKIARYVRSGGDLAVDVYNKNYWRNYHTPMYLIRPLTKRISHERLYRCLAWGVPRLLPISTWLRDHIPVIGCQAKALIPIANYNGVFPTESRSLLEQYSILDTFDTLAPQYISPQRPEIVRQWFADAGYESIQSDNNTVCAISGKKSPESEVGRLSRLES